MRAISFTAFGEADVLRLSELPDPSPGAGELTIDVEYAAVGLIDVLVRRGDFPAFSPPITPGLSVAGRVREVGPGTSPFSLGQRVAAFTAPPAMGGYASIARVDAARAVALETPSGSVTSAAGAVAIVNGPTAYLALHLLAGVRAGEAVVVHGAAGALGGMAVQVARQLGASPLFATVGDGSKRDHVARLGASDVLLSTDDWPSIVRSRTDGHGAAAIVDPVGGRQRSQSLAALRPLGRLVAVGHASSDPDAAVSPSDLWLGNQAILGLNVGALSASDPARFNDAARAVMALVAAGSIQPDVGAVLPLADAAEAHRRLEARSATGTMLLQVGG